MACITIFGTAFTLWMVHYCMHKGWYIKDLKDDSYRNAQLQINIHHENERVFIDNNDFVKYKSHLIDHTEEDLDAANLNIQQDLVDIGKKYLKTYNKRKDKHKKNKKNKKKQVNELLSEVEGLIGVLNSDQTSAQIHWLDLEVMQEGVQVDDKAIKRQIERQMDQLQKQEEQQDNLYKAKKEELLKNASERERQLYEQARERMIMEEDENARKFNQTDELAQEDREKAQELAIYDNGDLKSKNNQLVLKIEKNDLLDEQERERLM